MDRESDVNRVIPSRSDEGDREPITVFGFISGPKDPVKQAERIVGSKDVTTISFKGGHIGIYVSGRAQKELAPALASWVKERCG